MINHPNRSLIVSTSPLLAYHGKKRIKTNVLKQLAKHREADEIVKGHYWQNGKGCAVGCTLHSGNHSEYEPRFGIPQMLARLEDVIFEGLPNSDAKLWPERFMNAIVPGTDLTRVGWQFLHWLLTDKTINPGINHPLVCDAVKLCADVLVPLTKGLPIDEAARSAARSAAEAAWSAASAARSAARSAAEAAWSAAAARSAWSAARVAEAARSARSAEAAWSAARAARVAAAEAESWKTMSAELIALIELVST